MNNTVSSNGSRDYRRNNVISPPVQRKYRLKKTSRDNSDDSRNVPSLRAVNSPLAAPMIKKDLNNQSYVLSPTSSTTIRKPTVQQRRRIIIRDPQQNVIKYFQITISNLSNLISNWHMEYNSNV